MNSNLECLICFPFRMYLAFDPSRSTSKPNRFVRIFTFCITLRDEFFSLFLRIN